MRKILIVTLFALILGLGVFVVHTQAQTCTNDAECPSNFCEAGTCNECGHGQYMSPNGGCRVVQTTCNPACTGGQQCSCGNDGCSCTGGGGGGGGNGGGGGGGGAAATCTTQTFVAGSVSPGTANPYDTVTVKCNYGKKLDCVGVTGAGLANCRYSRYEGTDTIFMCDASPNAGYFNDTTCVLNAGTAGNCCAATNKAGDLTILGTDVHYDQDIVLPFGSYTLSARVHTVFAKNKGVRVELVCNSDTCANNTTRNATLFSMPFTESTDYGTQTKAITLTGTGDDRHYFLRVAVDKGSEAYFDTLSLKNASGKEQVVNGDFTQTVDGTVTTQQPASWGEGDNRIGYYYGSILGAATGNVGGGTTGTTTTTTTATGPTPTPGPASTINLTLKIKLQGISTKPANSNPINVQVKLGGGGLTAETAPQTGQFTVDANGVWTGKVSFAKVPTGGGYRIYVKGPKQIQKKVCDAAPSETDQGTYHCADGTITLQAGDNTFDFTKITQMAGDLPQAGGAQNGIIDSYDTTFIRTNLGTTDAGKLAIGDLNLDNIIDTQDISMIYKSLSIKYDDL